MYLYISSALTGTRVLSLVHVILLALQQILQVIGRLAGRYYHQLRHPLRLWTTPSQYRDIRAMQYREDLFVELADQAIARGQPAAEAIFAHEWPAGTHFGAALRCAPPKIDVDFYAAKVVEFSDGTVIEAPRRNDPDCDFLVINAPLVTKVEEVVKLADADPTGATAAELPVPRLQLDAVVGSHAAAIGEEGTPALPRGFAHYHPSVAAALVPGIIRRWAASSLALVPKAAAIGFETVVTELKVYDPPIAWANNDGSLRYSDFELAGLDPLTGDFAEYGSRDALAEEFISGSLHGGQSFYRCYNESRVAATGIPPNLRTENTFRDYAWRWCASTRKLYVIRMLLTREQCIAVANRGVIIWHRFVVPTTHGASSRSSDPNSRLGYATRLPFVRIMARARGGAAPDRQFERIVYRGTQRDLELAAAEKREAEEAEALAKQEAAEEEAAKLKAAAAATQAAGDSASFTWVDDPTEYARRRALGENVRLREVAAPARGRGRSRGRGRGRGGGAASVAANERSAENTSGLGGSGPEAPAAPSKPRITGEVITMDGRLVKLKLNLRVGAPAGEGGEEGGGSTSAAKPAKRGHPSKAAVITQEVDIPAGYFPEEVVDTDAIRQFVSEHVQEEEDEDEPEENDAAGDAGSKRGCGSPEEAGAADGGKRRRLIGGSVAADAHQDSDDETRTAGSVDDSAVGSIYDVAASVVASDDEEDFGIDQLFSKWQQEQEWDNEETASTAEDDTPALAGKDQ